MRIPVLLLASLLAACGTSEAPVVVSDVEITRPVPGRHMSAGFLVVTNNTDAAVRITSVTSPQFANVEIHETTITDGISRMRELEALLVPPHGSVTLERGSKHLMLMRPRELEDSVTLQFFSDDAPVLTIDYAFPAEDEGR